MVPSIKSILPARTMSGSRETMWPKRYWEGEQPTFLSVHSFLLYRQIIGIVAIICL